MKALTDQLEIDLKENKVEAETISLIAKIYNEYLTSETKASTRIGIQL